MSRIGSISAVSSASMFRRDSRRQRPTRMSATLAPDAVRRSPGASSRPGTGRTASSDMAVLLQLGAGRLGAGRVPGEGQEDVVQGRGAQREGGQQGGLRIDLVEQPADLGGTAVGGQ